MEKKSKGFVPKICLWAGAGLLVAAAVLMLVWQWGIQSSEKQAADYLQTIYSLIPEPQGAAVEARRDNTMAVLSVDGTDFVGILEMPRYESALPVCGSWGNPDEYPCRFSGSVYDGSIQIGATSQKGQYDFYQEISVGDSLFFTDMEGNRYSYRVTQLHYADHADQTALQRETADLTLFIKNVYDFEYLILFCQAG